MSIALSNTSTYGEVPESFADFKDLGVLDLSSNMLTGFISGPLFANMDRLRYLDLGYNQFTGFIPESIGKLKNLKHLSFYQNSLHGPIPDTIGNLHHLQFLEFGHNQLVGRIPESIGKLKNLQSMGVRTNFLNGPIPDAISEMNQLQFLDFSRNQLTDQSRTQTTTSSAKVIIMVAVTSGSILLLILGLAAYIWRRQRPSEMEKKNKSYLFVKFSHDIDELGQVEKKHDPEIQVIEGTTVIPHSDTTPTEPPKVSPLENTIEESEQKPVLIKQYGFAKLIPMFKDNNSGITSILKLLERNNLTTCRQSPSQSQQISRYQLSHYQKKGLEGINGIRVWLILFSYLEVAPTSNTDLEIHLQRSYGLFHTWNHALVMKWARLKELDPTIVDIMKDYHIDGSLLATLDVHSLKEKCNVQEFRIRAKFIQAVEVLKDSRNVLSTSMNNDATGLLPRYEGRDDENETNETFTSTTDES
ncbi:hypothetical protein HDU76_000351 [Blyttiomyces sp. JEL0837]|nr:hypothetical protein HDU76_000351 [Blyttiomyces sp. JEL0837]